MSSPFPGMDPYIEDDSTWPAFHSAIIYVMYSLLSADLMPRYTVNMGERVVLQPVNQDRIPDVMILERLRPSPATRSGGGAAVLTADPAHHIVFQQEELRETYIEIYSGKDRHDVLTIIEVLSPTNKAAGTTAHEEYLRKQEQILHSRTHLLEIDLLRRGANTAAAPRRAIRESDRTPYVISLFRGDEGDGIYYWPIGIRDRLPRIDIPLKDGDADYILDLQAVFNRVYEEGAYQYRFDYRAEPPAGAFSGADAVWLDALLREKGLRTQAIQVSEQ